VPLGIWPAFEIADPTVKRKSGFLFPGVRYKSELGFGLAIPYYIALSPTYDLTLTGTGYTNQGFLAEAEWRQRFNHGEYSIRLAGISQADPGEFDQNTVDSGPEGDPNRLRGMMGTTGRFAINSRWDFGWDVLVQSDKNFSDTYDIQDYSDRVYRSSIYLTGLDDRNFFDLRAMHFQVQEEVLDDHPDARNDKQPWVLPSFDYSRTADQPVFGGELNVDVNARALSRSSLDAFPLADPLNVRGIDGTSSRLTAEAEWKRSMTTEGGLVVMPLLAFQADTTSVDASAASLAAIDSMASNLGVVSDIRSAYHRFMAAAGLELRFPVLFSSVSSSHILEPMAQVFVRPDESYVGTLDVPNEDAQSFVFDATTLFERDKFSGYDRIEGGARANIGFRYSATYDNGWTANGLLGQSYHLAGTNSFAAPDLVNAGASSGLETDTSDFVGLFGIGSPLGFSGSVSARLDERTLEMRRAELKAGYTSDRLSVSAKYAFIQAQPLYSFETDREELSLGASTRFHENWRVFGSGTYDLEKNLLLQDAIGLAYDDECFTYIMTLSESRDRDSRETSRTIGFNLSFRTLGDVGGDTGGVAGL
jgi:LPS-assembly protein